jgi:hypothetical protein
MSAKTWLGSMCLSLLDNYVKILKLTMPHYTVGKKNEKHYLEVVKL